jgi:ribonuclease BN (tRNA processing enzyme)
VGLSITALGCSGTWASADSACSGFLVTDGTTKLWVDCGPGTLSALQRHCRLEDLDAIVVTHEHPDHCLELPVVRNALVHGQLGRDVPLYTTRGVLALLETFVGTRGLTPAFIPKMVGDGSVARVGGIRMQFSRTDHPVETLAVRFDDEAGGSGSIGYSSDTGPGWSLSKLGALDVAVVEATFLQREVGDAESVHRTAHQTGTDAKAAGAGRLVITHVTPRGDGEANRAEAEAAFGGPTLLAKPHERYDTHEA